MTDEIESTHAAGRDASSRRGWLRRLLMAAPTLAAGGCALPPGGLHSAGLGGAARKAAAKREFQTGFLASGAAFRYHPYGGQGRAWTSRMESTYRANRRDPRVAYAVKNLHTGAYLAGHQADLMMDGGSMPKPAVAATLLEKRQGRLTREEFQHIVYVCDKSINGSWMALLARLNAADERAFEWKYGLPDVEILKNAQTPRFYAEFFERCVNYRLDYGCELLLEAMRRDQYGFGRLYLPSSITYAGGKTGNYGEVDHEALFFYYGSTPYAIVLYTKGHFAPAGQQWKLGAMMGGLFREYIA